MNFTVLILCIVGGILAMMLFYGYIGSFNKMFQNTSVSPTQSSQLKEKQHRTIEDAHLKQQRLMEDIKQKIADNSRKF